MRQPLVAGNWKMHGSLAGTRRLIGRIREQLPEGLRGECLVCPPFVHLQAAAEALDGAAIQLGAQNLSAEPSGAFTGEISAQMLLDAGCRYVIVGHSERRALCHEDDDAVAAKFVAASEAGLVPVLCVGETLAEHDAGATHSRVRRQLETVLGAAGVAAMASAVVAYEPVWAIGTGKTATPAHAQDVHAFIRGVIASQDATIADSLRILYGGSVKPGNAAELFGMDDVDGGLIGGASLDAVDFVAICTAAG